MTVRDAAARGAPERLLQGVAGCKRFERRQQEALLRDGLKPDAMAISFGRHDTEVIVSDS